MTALSLENIQKRLKTTRIPPVYLMLIAILVVSLILDQIYGRGQMIDPTILTNILVRSVALGIVAIGQTFVMIAASIDLSVAYLISVTAVMSSFLMQGDPARVPMAVAVVFAIGAVVGLVNGLIITKLKVNAFIATLGTGLILRGALNASFSNFTGGGAGEFPNAWIWPLGAGTHFDRHSVCYRHRGGLYPLSHQNLVPIYTVLAGMKSLPASQVCETDRVVIIAHVVCSMTAVLTGLFVVSRLRSGAPWIGPDGLYDLESIAAVVVGGTALSGGVGSVAGNTGRGSNLRYFGYSLQPTGRGHLPQICVARGHHHSGSCQLHHSLQARGLVRKTYG